MGEEGNKALVPVAGAHECSVVQANTAVEQATFTSRARGVLLPGGGSSVADLKKRRNTRLKRSPPVMLRSRPRRRHRQ